MSFAGILTSIGMALGGVLAVFFAGAQNQKGRQALNTIKRFKKNKKTYRQVEAKHEEFKRKNDLESARKSFLSS